MKGKKTSTTQLARLYELRLEGHTDEEIRLSMRLSAGELDRLSRLLIDSQADALAAESAKQTFAKYSLDQRRNLAALDRLVTDLDRGRQYNAVVGAIKARADIRDKILLRGQELGVHHRADMKAGAVGGSGTTNNFAVLSSDLPPKELKAGLATIVREFAKLSSDYGDHDMAELPLPSLYSGEADPEGVITTTAVEVEEESNVRQLRPRKKRRKKKA